MEYLKGLVSEKLDQAQRKRKTQSLEGNERKPKRQRHSKEMVVVEEVVSEAVSEDDQISTGSSEKTDEIPDDENIESVLKDKEGLKKKKKTKSEVCEACGIKDGRLYSCSKCKLVYHSECGIDQGSDSDSILCANCQPNAEASCFLCKQTEGEFFKCSMKQCGRNFHRSCLNNFHSPSAKQDRPPSQFICPIHFCHTCVAHFNNIYHPDKKLIHCIKCPTAYHSSMFFIITKRKGIRSNV